MNLFSDDDERECDRCSDAYHGEFIPRYLSEVVVGEEVAILCGRCAAAVSEEEKETEGEVAAEEGALFDTVS